MRVLSQPISSDSADIDAISGAIRWVEGLLTGTIATGATIAAVATVGLSMLAGRLDWRKGTTVVLGCFVLFGAPAIAAGIGGIAKAVTERDPIAENAPEVTEPLASIGPTQPSVYDPYSGAAVAPK